VLNLSKVPFPNEPVAEWTVVRPFTAPGMFAFRHMQADGLLEFPDFAGGDMTLEQRQEALNRAVTLHRPLTALVIFLNVVALEDFLRDFGARLADVDSLTAFFPRIEHLRLTPRKPNPSKPSARLDDEPVSYTNFEAVNVLYLDCLGVEPLASSEIPRLYDLALVRHTVAHNGAIFRAVDVPRFQYYSVTPNQLINPPIPFVKETCSYLYSIGRAFEDTIRNKIISEVLPKLNNSWVTTTPKLLLDLIELFNYFGKVITSYGPPVKLVYSLDDVLAIMKEESDKVKAQLVTLCIEELKASYAPKSPAP
jgi:hypothetical protein